MFSTFQPVQRVYHSMLNLRVTFHLKRTINSGLFNMHSALVRVLFVCKFDSADLSNSMVKKATFRNQFEFDKKVKVSLNSTRRTVLSFPTSCLFFEYSSLV